MKNSYYCSARNGGTIRGSEQQIINRCNSDPRCTGYDYRKVGNYGHLCRQPRYPGSSRKCCGYKLCSKGGNVRVNGNWGRWGAYARCSKTCGLGVQSRRRSCNNPAPRNGGSGCPGSSVQSRRCNLRICPTSTYSCLDGTRSLVNSMKNSYYCSARNGGTIRGSEQQVINRCNSDPRCTGYDYRKAGNYGHMCRQTSYPGSSRKCCGYKLCKKGTVAPPLTTARPTPRLTTARPPTAPRRVTTESRRKPTTGWRPQPTTESRRNTTAPQRSLYRIVIRIQITIGPGAFSGSPNITRVIVPV